jgi:hypothetical protein
MRGLRFPPLAELNAWVAVLGLDGPEREQLVLAANLAHCPPLIVDYINHLHELTNSTKAGAATQSVAKPTKPTRNNRPNSTGLRGRRRQHQVKSD